MEAAKTDTFKISIGDTEQNYILCTTTAPKSYDGFGTIELTTGAVRNVLIQEKHFTWQSSRYYSGLKSCNIKEIDKHINRYLTGKMFERIAGKTE